MRTPKILCVGHACYDIAMAVSHHPQDDEKAIATAMQCGGGGPAANAAVCIQRLGGQASFCGYLGRDTLAELHFQQLQQQGVGVSHVVRGDAISPVSQILAKPDGTRALVNYRQHTVLAKDAVHVNIHDFDVLLFDGHEPEVSFELCRQARACGIPVIMDAGSLYVDSERLLTQVDYLVASEKFARAICNRHKLDDCLNILAQKHQYVVITCGAQGLLWASHGEQGRMSAFTVQAVDSTGAGDAFHGAFALAVAQGVDLQQALHFASAVGALTCTKLGARSALPELAAVQQFLADENLV